ncbi:hypothetical protein KIPB_014335 [Kipferlia bialata]|uniref:PPPDE domain-containing protein n=1 Tax=Kipferlia bialata TaxID=797122 RepID=A0A9K3DC59_9EUKA|nr:hypothetical protein KIPB_014335 [Kipferlia bialata]|eukprot:g14335.t1
MAGEFIGRDYDLLRLNCNTFTDAMLRRILTSDKPAKVKGLPGFVNRLARVGGMFSCCLDKYITETEEELALPQNPDCTATPSVSHSPPSPLSTASRREFSSPSSLARQRKQRERVEREREMELEREAGLGRDLRRRPVPADITDITDLDVADISGGMGMGLGVSAQGEQPSEDDFDL